MIRLVPDRAFHLGGAGAMAVPLQRRLDVEEIGDFTIATFTDDKIIDDQTVRAVGDELFHLAKGRKKILLNFSAAKSLSSAAVELLATLKNKVKTAGGHMLLAGVGPQLYDVLGIANQPSDEDDPDAGFGGVLSRLKPLKPSGGQSAALRPPDPFLSLNRPV